MLFEAGLISLLRTLLIFVLIYYGFKLIARFLGPYFIKWFLKKQSAKFNNPNYGSTTHQNTGEVNIKTKASDKEKEDTLGDYVDYEELD